VIHDFMLNLGQPVVTGAITSSSSSSWDPFIFHSLETGMLREPRTTFTLRTHIVKLGCWVGCLGGGKWKEPIGSKTNFVTRQPNNKEPISTVPARYTVLELSRALL
jgi:hypothetical protein